MAVAEEGRSGRWQALQRELGQRLADRLFDDIAASAGSMQACGRANRSTGSASRWLALVLAGLIYATGLCFGIAGAAILVAPWGNFIVVIIALCLLLLCLAARPRLTPVPDQVVARADYPTLYALCDRIAERMPAPPIAGVGIGADFGANYRAAGWRLERYVELGAPLVAVLSRQERVAVIAHELSHGANGDPLRGWFLLGAVNTLSIWAIALRPTSIAGLGGVTAVGPIVSIAAIPFQLMMLALSEALFLGVKLILLLVLRESQRAEYLADRLAATVSGTAAMQSALEKTYLHGVVDAAARRHALTTPEADIEPALAAAGCGVSESELAVFREQSHALKWQVDSTHPPTSLRVQMLGRSPALPAPALLSEQEGWAFDAEVARLIASQRREIVNRKLEASYG